MSDRDDEQRSLLDSNKKVTVQPSAAASTDAGPAAPVLPPTDADSSPALASHQSETVAASQSGSDRNEAASSPATGVVRESTNDGEGYANGITAEPSVSGREQKTTDEATSAPEVSEAEKSAEPSAADSVATIATSSVVDDIPPSPEDTSTPKPTAPAATGNTTSGLVFDDLDGADTPDLTKPSQSLVAGGTDGGAPAASTGVAREPARSSEAFATQPAESELVGGSKTAEPAVMGQAVVSHHKQSGGAGKVLAILLVLLILALIAFDILLDMGILNMTNLPHTNFLPSN